MAAVLMVCTVISCTGLVAELAHSRQTQTPPCHQHQKLAAPQTANPCDHQQAVATDNMGLPLADAALTPVAAAAPPLTAGVPEPDLLVTAVRPPGSAVPSSVLRI